MISYVFTCYAKQSLNSECHLNLDDQTKKNKSKIDQ